MMYKPILCSWTMIDFAMNKDYIAAYLCENKDQVELACQGRCFLMQKLKKRANDAADHQAKQLTQLSKIELMDVHEASIFLFGNSAFQIIERFEATPGTTDYLASIFHPPIT